MTPARRQAAERGFTLLELIVALLLLALMAAVMVGSVSLSARSWDGGEA
jgi:prepilin-type N-terminal cleavage/methylation domain-containing protein